MDYARRFFEESRTLGTNMRHEMQGLVIAVLDNCKDDPARADLVQATLVTAVAVQRLSHLLDTALWRPICKDTVPPEARMPGDPIGK